MKFQQTLDLEFPPEVADRYLTDKKALDYLVARNPEVTAIEVVEDRREGDTRFVAMRYATSVSLPGPVKKILGGAGSPSMLLKLTVNAKDASGTMEMVPSQLSDKIRIFARVAVEERGGRRVQRMDGEATVQMFGVGKMIEKFLVERIQNSSATEFRLRNEFIRNTLSGRGPA